MDYQVIWDDEAIAELGKAVRYIASDNPLAARKTGETIIQKAGTLAAFPRLGKIYSKLNLDDVREIPVPPYRIIYQVKDGETVGCILKVWRGAGRNQNQMKHFKAIAAMSLNRASARATRFPGTCRRISSGSSKRRSATSW